MNELPKCHNSRSDPFKGYRLAGSDSSLPTVIKDLRPSFVIVKTNGVMLMMGSGRSGYAISWVSNARDPARWDLESNAEGLRTILYSENRTNEITH